MTRVSFADLSAADIVQAATAIAGTRADGRLLNIDKVLLHSPELALGWRAFFSAVRTRCRLSEIVRELVILRVAVLNRADYEFAQHAPLALTKGLSQAQIDQVRRPSPTGFDPAQQLVLELCDAMTRDVQLTDDLVSRLKRVFDDRDLVELVVTVSAYNCVSRVLEALDVQNESPR